MRLTSRKFNTRNNYFYSGSLLFLVKKKPAKAGFQRSLIINYPRTLRRAANKAVAAIPIRPTVAGSGIATPPSEPPKL